MGAILLVRSGKAKASFPKTMAQDGKRRRNQTFLPCSPCARDSRENTESVWRPNSKHWCATKSSYCSGTLLAYYHVLFFYCTAAREHSAGHLYCLNAVHHCQVGCLHCQWKHAFISQFAGYLLPFRLNYPQWSNLHLRSYIWTFPQQGQGINTSGVKSNGTFSDFSEWQTGPYRPQLHKRWLFQKLLMIISRCCHPACWSVTMYFSEQIFHELK